jgi:uncharacterized protein (TIGR03435 family)
MLAALAFAAYAQTFAVSSVKPSADDGARKGPPPFAVEPTRLAIHKQPLKRIIAYAFDLRPFEVTGGPAWMESDPYDVDAKTEEPATREQMLAMLRRLLTNRFQLKFHRETKELAQPVLVVAKNGPKFGPQFHPSQDAPLSDFRIPLKGYTMEHLAFFLTDNRHMWDIDAGDTAEPDDPPVVDKTGLSGTYDIGLNFAPRKDWLAEFERQTGLKVEIRKLSSQILVVESASKPAVN